MHVRNIRHAKDYCARAHWDGAGRHSGYKYFVAETGIGANGIPEPGGFIGGTGETRERARSYSKENARPEYTAGQGQKMVRLTGRRQELGDFQARTVSEHPPTFQQNR